MGGIAEVLLNLGYRVQGSDLEAERPSPSGCASSAREVRDRPRGENLGAADVVVVSSAVAADNPEVLAAHERRIPVVPRAEMLARAHALPLRHRGRGHARQDDDHEPVASVLAEGGEDPTFVIGGRLQERGQRTRGSAPASISSPRRTRATRRSCICSR